jgi:DNA-binding LytR/AlgR family response regulator
VSADEKVGIRQERDMLKIGICDMDADFVKNLVEMLNDILYQYAEWEARIFSDSEEVVQAIDEGSFQCNLLFMDIFQKKQTGVSVAEYIDEKHVDTDIIFVTTSKDYVFECYRHHTFAYLLKPLQEYDISKEIKRYLSEMEVTPKCLTVSNRKNVTRIPLDNILFIESNYRTVIVHTQNQAYEYYEKLDQLEKVLGKDGFIRCHQSYLVNVDMITAFDGKVLQVGKFAVSVSRKYKESVKKALDLAGISITKNVVQQVESRGNRRRDGAYRKYEQYYLTSGVFQNNDTEGALVCVQGAYIGNIVRIVPEQVICIGRDGTTADMIVNLPLVSRKHCTIIYHEQDHSYEVKDCSTNGTFVDGDERLTKGDTYLLKAGATLSFGDKNTIYKLG